MIRAAVPETGSFAAIRRAESLSNFAVLEPDFMREFEAVGTWPSGFSVNHVQVENCESDQREDSTGESSVGCCSGFAFAALAPPRPVRSCSGGDSRNPAQAIQATQKTRVGADRGPRGGRYAALSPSASALRSVTTISTVTDSCFAQQNSIARASRNDAGCGCGPASVFTARRCVEVGSVGGFDGADPAPEWLRLACCASAGAHLVAAVGALQAIMRRVPCGRALDARAGANAREGVRQSRSVPANLGLRPLVRSKRCRASAENAGAKNWFAGMSRRGRIGVDVVRRNYLAGLRFDFAAIVDARASYFRAFGGGQSAAPDIRGLASAALLCAFIPAAKLFGISGLGLRSPRAAAVNRRSGDDWTVFRRGRVVAASKSAFDRAPLNISMAKCVGSSCPKNESLCLAGCYSEKSRWKFFACLKLQAFFARVAERVFDIREAEVFDTSCLGMESRCAAVISERSARVGAFAPLETLDFFNRFLARQKHIRRREVFGTSCPNRFCVAAKVWWGGFDQVDRKFFIFSEFCGTLPVDISASKDIRAAEMFDISCPGRVAGFGDESSRKAFGFAIQAVNSSECLTEINVRNSPELSKVISHLDFSKSGSRINAKIYDFSFEQIRLADSFIWVFPVRGNSAAERSHAQVREPP